VSIFPFANGLVEQFWVDIMLKNPLDVEITLSDLTVRVESSNTDDDIVVETIDEILLRPKESRIVRHSSFSSTLPLTPNIPQVPLCITSNSATTIKIANLNYSFFSLLPVSESLAVRGRRLQETPTQRRGTVYGPDVIPSVIVQQGGRRLEVSLTKSDKSARGLSLAAGECAEFTMNLRNVGSGIVDDIWVIHSPDARIDLGNQCE